MARGVHNRLTRAEKEAKGTLRPSRERAGNVVPFPPLDFEPQPPEWFTDDACAEWERLCPVFMERGTLTKATITEFEDLCDMRGAVIEKRRRGVSVSAGERQEIRRKLELFGVTRPSADIGPAGRKENPFERNGRRGT